MLVPFAASAVGCCSCFVYAQSRLGRVNTGYGAVRGVSDELGRVWYVTRAVGKHLVRVDH